MLEKRKEERISLELKEAHNGVVVYKRNDYLVIAKASLNLEAHLLNIYTDVMKMLASTIKHLLFIIFPTLVSCNMAPGSYPYAEKYEIIKTEDVLVSAILDFLKDNPQYIVPAQSQL